MAYFLGRDVVVAITTEDTSNMVVVASGAATDVDEDSLGSQAVFAGPRVDLNAGTDDDSAAETIFGTQTTTGGSNPTFSNEVADLTGVDLTIGATDEDIAYMGQRTALKAEIKKDTSITLTRKKKADTFDVAFNDARFGIQADGSGLRDAAAGAPDDNNYGYRVYVKMKDNSEVFVMRNCCITGYSVSLSPEGIQEETLEFYSEVDAKHVGGDANANTTLTTLTEL